MVGPACDDKLLGADAHDGVRDAAQTRMALLDDVRTGCGTKGLIPRIVGGVITVYAIYSPRTFISQSNPNRLASERILPSSTVNFLRSTSEKKLTLKPVASDT